MARSATPQRQVPSQENLLLDYIHRLEAHRQGRGVVHLHLSGLAPFNRREQHIRAAANGFEGLVRALQGQLFTLKSADIFFVFKSDAHLQVETVVRKIRYLFSDDPLLTEEGIDTQAFCTWYNAETEFQQIVHLVQDLVDEEQRRRKQVARDRMDARTALKVRQERGVPLTPEVLERMETVLQRTDLSNLVRRQFVCGISRELVPDRMFSEMFISIADLRETLLPGVNVLSNRWLFQHLTETLDRRMLSLLNKTDGVTISGEISINLNISTLLSPEFLDFDDNVIASRRGSVIIELQKLDIFADLGAYLFAREFVQSKGYRVCIDGLTYQTLPMIDRERLGADYIKIIWSPEMISGGDEIAALVRDMVAHTGNARVILCRVDHPEAVDFGHSVGIRFFQGRHVESLIAEDERRRALMRLKHRIERD
jgi:EAL domain-containing protein (putative c-di-GMP-specific phosphodiesterase class I)